MGIKTYILIKTSFEGYHNWPDAPQEVEFLRFPHRHLFHVEAKIPVFHDDRYLEFFMVKRVIDNFIKEKYPTRVLKQKSCEMLAREVIEALTKEYGIKRDMSVSVFEDNENGSVIEI